MNSGGLHGNEKCIRIKDGKHVGYVSFGLHDLPDNLGGTDVSKAVLRVWVSKVIKIGTIQVSRADGEWTEDDITGLNEPAAGELIGQEILIGKDCKDSWVSIDVTDLVRDWIDGVSMNDGVAIRAGIEGGSFLLDSKERNDGHSPELEIILLAGGVGPEGPMGPQGLQGIQGIQGIQGMQGVVGDAGPPGSDGLDGTPGADGADGAPGVDGVDGAPGAAGADGAPGDPGPAGTGGLAEYACICNEGSAIVPLETDITFDSNGFMSGGISHVLGSSSILLTTGGLYSVTFSVSGVEPNQFAVFLNGALVEGSVFGSGAGTQQNIGQVILIAFDGDVLSIRNHTSAAAITLQTLAGGTQVNANASVLIMKIQ